MGFEVNREDLMKLKKEHLVNTTVIISRRVTKLEKELNDTRSDLFVFVNDVSTFLDSLNKIIKAQGILLSYVSEMEVPPLLETRNLVNLAIQKEIEHINKLISGIPPEAYLDAVGIDEDLTEDSTDD